MIITTAEVLERYNMKDGTLKNRRDIIQNAGGFLARKAKGSSKNYYKTSVMDRLAENGDLGGDALVAITNKREKEADLKEQVS